MERLSERWMYYCGLLAVHGVPVDDMKHIQNLIDAEEQGLLLRLPVSEGSTVFTLGYIYECKHDYECVLKYNKNKCEENVPCEHEHKQWMVREAVFNYKMLKAIGTTVFFTKEEAEQALERMEGEHE